MLTAVLLFCVGLLCLVKGGDWFVDGAVGIARRFHLPDLLIGATVVSVGTTLPEVMISASSALGGHGEIAYGNAIGSIICNAALVAAITIAVRPGKADAAALRLPVSFFFIAAVFYAAVAYTTGTFTQINYGVVAPSGTLAGCLLLDVEDIDLASGEPQAFIIYLAVAPPWRDGRLAKRLVRHAAREAYKRGCRYLAAEVGLGPHGQLKTTQWLGFKPERCIVSIPCTPQGLPPAPGAKALQG